jgi:hypothetical protein
MLSHVLLWDCGSSNPPHCPWHLEFAVEILHEFGASCGVTPLQSRHLVGGSFKKYLLTLSPPHWCRMWPQEPQPHNWWVLFHTYISHILNREAVRTFLNIDRIIAWEALAWNVVSLCRKWTMSELHPLPPMSSLVLLLQPCSLSITPPTTHWSFVKSTTSSLEKHTKSQGWDATGTTR